MTTMTRAALLEALQALPNADQAPSPDLLRGFTVKGLQALLIDLESRARPEMSTEIFALAERLGMEPPPATAIRILSLAQLETLLRQLRVLEDARASRGGRGRGGKAATAFGPPA